ncbi:MAG: hypothetical protein AB7V32_05490 [Candidatus Berkiella sp.]
MTAFKKLTGKSMSHTFHPLNREPLFDALKNLAQDENCFGPIAGMPPLPDAKGLNLNKILHIQIMMGVTPDRTQLSLELGANPNHSTRGITRLQLARAFAKRYGDNSIVKQLESYGAKDISKKKRPSKGV